MMLRLANVSGNPGRIAANAQTETTAAQDDAEIREASGDAPMETEQPTLGSPREDPASPAGPGEGAQFGQAAIAGTLRPSPAGSKPAIPASGPGDPRLFSKNVSRRTPYGSAIAAASAKPAVDASTIHASASPASSGAKSSKEPGLKPGAPGATSVPGSPAALNPEIPVSAPAAQPLSWAHPQAPQASLAESPQRGTQLPAQPAGFTDVAPAQPQAATSLPEAEAPASMQVAAPADARILGASSPSPAAGRPTDASTIQASKSALPAFPRRLQHSIPPPLSKAGPIPPATPEPGVIAATVRQAGPAEPQEPEAMQPAEGVTARDPDSITTAGSDASSEAVGEAKPAFVMDAGTMQPAPASSVPLSAATPTPETPETTHEFHATASVLQAAVGNAEHHAPATSSETGTTAHAGKNEPVRAAGPPASESSSIASARLQPHGPAQIANPPAAISETPAASSATAAIPRIANLVTASLASLPAASPSAASAAAALEQMDAAAPPPILAGSPHRLAVGIHDSALGWVEIRTHAAEGQISAVLATGSNEARATAAAYLPEVREYLAGQHIAVGHLSAETYSAFSDDRRGSPDTSSGDGGTANQAGPAHQRPQENFIEEPIEEISSHISVRV